jgi:hypothetical protein
MTPCVQIYTDSTGKGFKTFVSELYCMISQAILWKELKNGPAYLYTDEESLEMIRSMGLLSVWDKINTKVLSSSSDIDSDVFWASCKHKVMQNLEAPFVICDLDFFSWFEINQPKYEYDFIGYHREDVEDNPCYSSTNPSKLMPDDNFNWNVNPINTAFILMSSNDLKEEYCKLSIDFMKASSKTPDTDKDSRRMVFIEQWFLASLLDAREYTNKTLLNSIYHDGRWKKTYRDIFNSTSKKCFHIWHEKFEFEKNPELEKRHIEKIIEIMKKYAPSKMNYLENIKSVNDKWLAYPKNEIYNLLNTK